MIKKIEVQKINKKELENAAGGRFIGRHSVTRLSDGCGCINCGNGVEKGTDDTSWDATS